MYIEKTPFHPCNPDTHAHAVRNHLVSAARENELSAFWAERGNAHAAAMHTRFSRCMMELACESAEEVALLSGLEYSIIPGRPQRAPHNDLWRAA